jgi:predicted DsbA family dithiol-disulfide isomerase
LKKEFDIHDEWLGFEIHPETPREGMLLTERFSAVRLEQMYDSLQQRGEALGITFGKLTILSNSRLAMEASEFARDFGKFDQFHEALFHAYFTETQDIGQRDVIMDLASQVGLESQSLQDALEHHRYVSRLEEVTQNALQLGINAAPTFIVNDMYKIVGAYPLDVFQEVFTKLTDEG